MQTFISFNYIIRKQKKKKKAKFEPHKQLNAKFMWFKFLILDTSSGKFQVSQIQKV